LTSRVGIVAFAFGSPASILPNRFLKEAAASVAFKQSARLILTQKELPFPSSITIVRFISEAENAEPTLRIARWAIEEAIKEGLTRLIVVAVGPHIWRCLRDIRWAIRQNKKAANIQVEEADLRGNTCAHYLYPPICYSVESTQPRSRSALAWWPRELLLRCMPMWLYAIIAG